jgi:HSP20 family protein
LWEDDEDMERFEASVERFFSQAFSEIESPLFDVESKTLKPLFRLEINDEWVIVAFDLPGAKKEDIEVTCTEDVISVEAEMRRPVSLRVSANKNKPARFERYAKKIRLPVRVDPDKGTAKYRNGMVVVKLPILRGGKAVKIPHR